MNEVTRGGFHYPNFEIRDSPGRRRRERGGGGVARENGLNIQDIKP